MKSGIGLLLIATALTLFPATMYSNDTQTAARDPHSYATPSVVRVRHVDLDLEVLFDKKTLRGTATLAVERLAPGPLVLDTRDLTVSGVEASADGKAFAKAKFALGAADPVLGSSLTVELPEKVSAVRVAYSTSPGASGLQWLEPSQTSGKKHPFLFTQSQAIHARSWVPLQDTPAVRITYSARVRTPRELVAVMSAENDPKAPRDGDYSFKMEQPIPSYLLAIAVGDIVFRPMGPRTGVYAEPSVVEAAARELDDTEKMMDAAERLYGPYRWGRYDLLILPPSFPFGGMENPRLTFATPTILAGDKSLVSLVAHELAHSWSGNLVTNATWSDLWLNEGFTTYVERRIVEEVFGRPRAEMEAALGRRTVEDEIAKLPPADTALHVRVEGRNPDDVFSQIPYEKGALMIRQLEETFGRERFDKFLRGYFDHFAFKSISTDEFLAYLRKNLFEGNAELAAKAPVEEWIFKPGLPASAPRPASDAFAKVEAQAKAWADGQTPTGEIATRGWTTQEWLHFLQSLPQRLEPARMAELDKAFDLTKAGNAEIAHVWLLMSIRNGYEPAYGRLEEYLVAIGRRKLIRPLYEELAKTPEGKQRALAIYRKARPGYHPIAVNTVDKIVGWGK